MAQLGEDCYFFYYSTCTKGQACPFRHVEEARGNEVECPLWRQRRCVQPACPYRHMELNPNRQVTPCYWESQPGGCTKPHCPFLHVKPKNLNLPPPPFTGPQPVRPQVPGPPPIPSQSMGPPPLSLAGPPLVRQPVGPPVMAHPPPPHWRGPGPRLAPPFQNFPSGPRPGPFGPEQGNVRMIVVPTVEPVVVNINSEESESDGSPVKPIRSVAPSIRKSQSDTSLIHPEIMPPSSRPEHNPLDYFLGAKPWVDPNPPQWDERRSPSPTGRPLSPIRFQARRNGSVSPAQSRGSVSPDRSRRRSTSEERHARVVQRKRSHSLDRSRSQSPDWRDRRRGRSPIRPRSRSPVGHRPFRGRFDMRRSPPRRIGRNLQRPQDRPQDRRQRPPSPEKVKPPVQEVIIPAGPKIISTKKEKKEEEKKDEDSTEKKEGEKEIKEEESGEVPLAEVRSLEDIYREKALKSLMEAKKKKVIENRRQKIAERMKKAQLENSEPVKTEESPEEKSDGENSDKSGDEKDEEEQSADSDSESSESGEEEGGAEEDEGGAEAETKGESDIDLADDVDIEIEAGEKESDGAESDRSDSDEHHSGSEGHKTDSSETEEKVVVKRKKTAKPNIKSRLGMKSGRQESKRTEIHKKREPLKQTIRDRLGMNTAGAPKLSVKDRLGKREDVIQDRPSVRSGVIKLGGAKPRDIPGSLTNIRVNRIDRDNYYGKDRDDYYEKDVMMVPKIVVRNRLDNYDERSRESSRSRHGYDDDYDSGSDYDRDSESEDEIIAKLAKRKKKLKKMLESEGSDYDEIELLRKEKKKIKKLLKERKKREKREKRRKASRKKEKKEREYSDDDFDDEEEEKEEERNRRRIKIQSRLGPAKAESERSEDEEKEERMEEEQLSEEAEVDDHEGEDADSKQAEKPKQLTEEEIQAREQLRQEKARKLQEALQPKTLDDIRKARAVKKSFEPVKGVSEGREKKTEGAGRRILLADYKEPSPPKPQVKVTFNEESKPPVRQRIRLKRDTEQNENKVPVANTTKTFRRERGLYQPPALKRTDGPVYVDKNTEEAIKRAAAGPADREIVDYADMFPSKKSKPSQEVGSDVPPTTSEPVRRLIRQPPKVEVENAGIKSFAEIMAEKKRKRLLAQQESKKTITPIVFEDKPDSGPAINRLTPDLKSRLSPEEDFTSSRSSQISTISSVGAKTSAIDTKSSFVSSVKSDVNSQSSRVKTSSPVAGFALKRTITPTKPVVKELNTQKPVRWKRRKPNTENEDCNLSLPETGENVETSKTDFSEIQKAEEDLSVSPIKSEKERKPSTEKKSARASDSLLDFEEELLADVDLDLDDNKSHDELMREMEELLA